MSELKSGIYKVTEEARTYHYKTMSVRVEGAKVIRRHVWGETSVTDEVYSGEGECVEIQAGWVGVTQESDSAPPSMELLSECVQHDVLAFLLHVLAPPTETPS